MANYVTLPRVSGPGSIDVAWYLVSSIRADPKSTSRCFVNTTCAVDDPWHIALAPAAVVALLHAASGLTATGTSPFAGLAMVAGGALYVQPKTAASVREDSANVLTRSFVSLAGNDGPWNVTGARAAVTALLEAADPNAAGAPAVAPRLVLQAVVYGGVIQSQHSDVGIVLSLTSPYVPGSALDHLTMTGANTPTNYALYPQSEIQPVTFIARPVAPGSPNFVVQSLANDRAIAEMTADALGSPSGTSWGVGTFTSGGAGINDYLLTSPPLSGNFGGTGVLTGGVVGSVSVSRVDATHVRVETFDAAGAHAGLACQVTVTGMSGADTPSGYQPSETAYTLQVFSLD